MFIRDRFLPAIFTPFWVWSGNSGNLKCFRVSTSSPKTGFSDLPDFPDQGRFYWSFSLKRFPDYSRIFSHFSSIGDFCPFPLVLRTSKSSKKRLSRCSFSACSLAPFIGPKPAITAAVHWCFGRVFCRPLPCDYKGETGGNFQLKCQETRIDVQAHFCRFGARRVLSGFLRFLSSLSPVIVRSRADNHRR